MNSISDVKPVFKWPGGKQNLAERLIAYFPDKFATYYEPFIGGASVLLAFNPENAVIGDLNEWLIDAYLAILTDHKKVVAYLDEMVNTKDEYDRVRDILPASLDLFQRAAHLIYLNKTCFRGLFRVNQKGQFNVSYGAYDRSYYDYENLAAVARILASADIRCVDFEKCLADVKSDDFVYLDPPYYKQGGYSDFDRYTKFKFKGNDHIRLARVCRELDKRGVRWALSNSDKPAVRSLFNKYRIESIEARREINLNSDERSIKELLVLNYELDAANGNQIRV